MCVESHKRYRGRKRIHEMLRDIFLHVQVTEIIQEEDEIDAVYDMRSQLCAWCARNSFI